MKKLVRFTILIIFLAPFIWMLCTYFVDPASFGVGNNYFSQFELYVQRNFWFFVWIFILLSLTKYNSILSFLNNIKSFLFFKELPKNMSEHNDGYISDEDFGKGIFAENILQMIDNFHKDTQRANNLVIGLNGEWGDGKSFVVKEMKKIINLGNFNNFYLFSFQPWLFEKNTNYTNAFLDKLDAELTKQQCGIPFLYLSAFKDMLNNSCGFLGKIFSYFINKTDEELKAAIQHKINQTKKQFIVVIDDLDRLEPAEMLQIFKLVRCVANFENMYFIICLDKELVEDSITKYIDKCSDTPNPKLTSYCDKIINLYFEVPMVSAEDLARLFNQFIEQDKELSEWKGKTAFNIYSEPIETHCALKNIRDVKILINKLHALSLFQYADVQGNPQLLTGYTTFNVIKTLELLKLKDFSLYTKIKNSILWQESFQDQNITDDKLKNAILQLIAFIKAQNNQYFYFAYDSGDLPLSKEQYRRLLDNFSGTTLSDLYKNRYLASFLSYAINDYDLSPEQFTNISAIFEQQRKYTSEFKTFFTERFSLLDCKKYFENNFHSLSDLYSYRFVNLVDNKAKQKEYIDEYVFAYNNHKGTLPEMNNLIFYIDFPNYTSGLYGILFDKLIKRKILEAPGLWDLLNKYILQTQGDVSNFDIRIFCQYCNSIEEAISKLRNDCNIAEEKNKSSSNEDDISYPNVIQAYHILIDYLNNNKGSLKNI